MSSTTSAVVDTPAPGPAGEKEAELFCGPHSADSAFGAIGSSLPTGPAPWEVPDLFHDFLERNVSRELFSPFLDFGPVEDHIDHTPLVDTAPECRSDENRPGLGNLDTLYADDSQRPLALVHTTPSSTSFSLLGDKISLVISSLNSFPWDQPGLVDKCADWVEAEKTPVSDALRCTEEFTRLLLSLNLGRSSTTEGNSAPVVSRPHREGSPGRLCHPNMATVLSILSTFLRILELYDILFSNLSRSLDKIPIGKIASMRIRSAVRIGNLQSMQDMPGLAYAQTVLFVIQSHIKALELGMSLPTRFCVVLQEAPVSGIFANDDLAPLLQQVMEHAGVGCLQGGMHHVESLRRNIRMAVDIFGGTGSI